MPGNTRQRSDREGFARAVALVTTSIPIPAGRPGRHMGMFRVLAILCLHTVYRLAESLLPSAEMPAVARHCQPVPVIPLLHCSQYLGTCYCVHLHDYNVINDSRKIDRINILRTWEVIGCRPVMRPKDAV